jgi:uncharacterized protein (DUF433 family)
MIQVAAAESIPLAADAEGTLWIAGSCVTLDTLLELYNSGSTAETIVQRYPDLRLADVYAALAYCLRHKGEIDTYLLSRRGEPQVSQVDRMAGKRAELLARKHGAEGLSGDDQDRLDLLTTRLHQVLPPVSPDDLQALLTMAEEVEQIREQARERRQRLGLK